MGLRSRDGTKEEERTKTHRNCDAEVDEVNKVTLSREEGFCHFAIGDRKLSKK